MCNQRHKNASDIVLHLIVWGNGYRNSAFAIKLKKEQHSFPLENENKISLHGMYQHPQVQELRNVVHRLVHLFHLTLGPYPSIQNVFFFLKKSQEIFPSSL